MEEGQYTVGDIVIAKIDTHYDDFIFLRVIGRTKSGNLRVERLKTTVIESSSTPSDSISILAPDVTTTMGKPEIARWSKVNERFQVKKNCDFHYVIRRVKQ